MQKTIPVRLFIFLFFVFAVSSNALAADAPKRLSDVKRITITELQELQADNRMVVIIDTRTPGQWQRATDKIPGAIRIDSQGALQKLKVEVQPDTEIITYCT